MDVNKIVQQQCEIVLKLASLLSMIVTCGSSVWFPDEQNAALLFENFAAGISVGEKVDLKKFLKIILKLGPF